MMWRGVAFGFVLLLVGLVSLHAQSVLGFPPGVFQTRGAIDAAPAASYTGLGDCSGCPSAANALFYVGLRAWTAATAGAKSANICNAGDANCADVNTLANGNFDVATATGAPLNCGGSGGTCTIKTLYDKTGAMDCSGDCDVTEATAANRPTLVFNCSGSLPCGQCNGTTSNLNSATPSIQFQPYTAGWVAKRTSVAAAAALSRSSPKVGWTASADTVSIDAGLSAIATATDNSFYALGGLFDGMSSKVSVNGSVTTGLDAGTGFSAFNPYFVCNSFGAAFLMTGQFLEFVWYSGDRSSGFGALSTNQRAYWGI